jgi:hypothetical protein
MNANHHAVEVSQATWAANGITSNGGFAVGFGGGMTVVNSAQIYYYVCQNHASMGMKGRIFVTSSTGIPPVVTPAQGLQIYPNPATPAATWITIKTNLQAGKENTVKIFNLLGNCMLQEENIPSPAYINTAGIPSGVYFVEIIAEGIVMQERLVVRR